MDLKTILDSDKVGLGQKQILRFKTNWEDLDFNNKPLITVDGADITTVHGFGSAYNFGVGDGGINLGVDLTTLIYNLYAEGVETFWIRQPSSYVQINLLPQTFSNIVSFDNTGFVYEGLTYQMETIDPNTNYVSQSKLLPIHTKHAFIVESYTVNSSVSNCSVNFFLNNEENIVPILKSNENFLADYVNITHNETSNVVGLLEVVLIGYFVEFRQLR